MEDKREDEVVVGDLVRMTMIVHGNKTKQSNSEVSKDEVAVRICL